MRVITVGGGIGGLAAACALRHFGASDVQVYERQPTVKAVGAGIAITANSMVALQELGLRIPLERVATVLQRSTVRSFRGTTLSRFPMAAAAHRFESSSVSLHRADLLTTLQGRLPPESIHVGSVFSHYEQDAGGVVGHFEDGTSVRGDLLIGADGIHSSVRRQLAPNNPKRYRGYLCWRGLTTEPFNHAALPPGLLIEVWGHGVRLGGSHIGAGRAHWWLAANLPEGTKRPEEGWKPLLRRLIHGWASPVPQLVDATDESAVVCMAIWDRSPEPRWVDGRVVLLGDAAHPMAPDLGQGANMAIEDCYVLGKMVATEPNLAAALSRYEALRRPRATTIQRLSRLWGGVGQWKSSAACELRNLGMWLWPDAVQRQGFISLMKWPR